ncbi:MAG: hypothetical protein AB7N76_18730 [Planctomycetota bacterium]
MIHRDRLSRQIHEALELSLPAELPLEIVDVLPGKTKSHYVVVFQPTGDEPIGQLEEQLDAMRDTLLDEVAAEVTRRSLPELTFRISPRFDWDALRQ